MANKESNHSSTERTILWIIVPATIFVSLLFTKLNHGIVQGNTEMNADFSLPKKEAKHEAAHAPAEATAAQDTTHMEAPAAPVEAPAHH